jgi:hypothetical protein
MAPPPSPAFQPPPLYYYPAERKPRTDPLLPVGIVTTSIGLTVASLGIPPALDGDGETSLPLLLAAGLTAGTGITLIAVGAEPVTTRRQSEDRVLGGGILASAGATAIGLGVAWRNAGALGTGLWVGGAGAVTAGVVMMVTGAHESDEPPPVPRRRAWHSRGEQVPRSPRRATAGMVLTFTGIGFAAVGGVVTAALWEDTDGWVMMGSGPAMGTGALLMGIGIPLWATGAALVPADELEQEEEASLRRPRAAPRGFATPEVAIGPGSFTARWTF